MAFEKDLLDQLLAGRDPKDLFTRMKGAMALFIRTIGIARARTRIGIANLAYNFQRLAWLNAKTAPA